MKSYPEQNSNCMYSPSQHGRILRVGGEVHPSLDAAPGPECTAHSNSDSLCEVGERSYNRNNDAAASRRQIEGKTVAHILKPLLTRKIIANPRQHQLMSAARNRSSLYVLGI